MRANHQKSHVIILIFDDLLAYKFSSTSISFPFPYTSSVRFRTKCPKSDTHIFAKYLIINHDALWHGFCCIKSKSNNN